MPSFDPVRTEFRAALERRVFPAAVIEVGGPDGVLWREAFGSLSCAPDSPPARPDTVFDLASLTKILATATLTMRMVEAGVIDLCTPVARIIGGWRGGRREGVTVADLLAHASGLPAFRPFYAALSGRAAFEAALCTEPLEYAPGTASVYSDLGFILLGFVLENLAGAGLDRQFDALVSDALASAARRGRPSPVPTSLDLRYGPAPGWTDRTAPTRCGREDEPARLPVVDDPNAAALDGVAGHAGLFGTASAVGWFAREWLGAWLGTAGFDSLGRPDTVRRFTTRLEVPGSSRALGWDTMLPTSSCGTRMSALAFGHTGFTGTSLWIDPVARVYVVLLTNRVHPCAGSPEPITALRRAVHDAVIRTVGGPAGDEG